MDLKAKVNLFFLITRVLAYFASKLALTFIRSSTLELLKCVIRPVFKPDTPFTDPATGRIYLIQGADDLDHNATPTPHPDVTAMTSR